MRSRNAIVSSGLVAVAVLVAPLRWSSARADGTSYLQEMPSVERVLAEVRSTNAIIAAARQVAVFDILSQMAMYRKGRLVPRQFDPSVALGDERFVPWKLSPEERQFFESYAQGAKTAAAPFAGTADAAKVEGLVSAMVGSKDFRSQVASRFFAPDRVVVFAQAEAALRDNESADLKRRKEENDKRFAAANAEMEKKLRVPVGAADDANQTPLQRRINSMSQKEARTTLAELVLLLLVVSLVPLVVVTKLAARGFPGGLAVLSADGETITLLGKPHTLRCITGDVLQATKQRSSRLEVEGRAGSQVTYKTVMDVYDTVFLRDAAGNEHSIELINFDLRAMTGNRASVAWAIPSGRDKGPYFLFRNHSTNTTFLGPDALRLLFKLSLVFRLLTFVFLIPAFVACVLAPFALVWLAFFGKVVPNMRLKRFENSSTYRDLVARLDQQAAISK